MAFMEGPLSKWTNVMKGWQYRWFVLDNNAGMLCYYTSKDKMMKGSRRGYVRLKNGLIGIDDEDDSTFTITTMNHQTFHFQARDNEERERWIEALERAIDRQRSNPVLFRGDLFSPEEYERKLMETDAYLQLLIEQNTIVQKKISACQDSSTKENLSLISLTTDAMIEAIKHAIVMLQISKESLKEPLLNGTLHEPPLTEQANFQHFSGARAAGGAPMRLAAPECNVPASYSSSDDEEFFDAEAPTVSPVKTPTKPSSPFDPKKTNMEDLYNINDEEDLGSMEKHGSVIGHLLKQVRIGMDLTKVVLPTFILERRSLLEMYADFFAHPDLFCKIADMKTPKERMIQTLKWYLSTFHAGRPSEIAKKPYNPIQGETFQCYWEVPGLPQTKELNDDGPVPWATKENLCFVAEQVSHHPPISAFYAEHKNKKLSLDGYIWTKSKFLGLSIGVHMIGQAVVSVHNHDEEYVLTFPNGYGRSILTVPWVELGGTTEITCSKTGFKSQIDFHTKPFYGGKKHLLTAKVFDPAEKKPVVVIEGEWNGVMYAKYSTGMNETFIDTKKIALHPKQVRPLADQGEFESRRLWKEVTICLKTKDVEGATNEKHRLESRQREEAKERKDAGTKWETKYFHEEGEHWVYDKPLTKRMA